MTSSKKKPERVHPELVVRAGNAAADVACNAVVHAAACDHAERCRELGFQGNALGRLSIDGQGVWGGAVAWSGFRSWQLLGYWARTNVKTRVRRRAGVCPDGEGAGYGEAHHRPLPALRRTTYRPSSGCPSRARARALEQREDHVSRGHRIRPCPHAASHQAMRRTPSCSVAVCAVSSSGSESRRSVMTACRPRSLLWYAMNACTTRATWPCARQGPRPGSYSRSRSRRCAWSLPGAHRRAPWRARGARRPCPESNGRRCRSRPRRGRRSTSTWRLRTRARRTLAALRARSRRGCAVHALAPGPGVTRSAA